MGGARAKGRELIQANARALARKPHAIGETAHGQHAAGGHVLEAETLRECQTLRATAGTRVAEERDVEEILVECLLEDSNDVPADCVPLPAPGGPKSAMLSMGWQTAWFR